MHREIHAVKRASVHRGSATDGVSETIRPGGWDIDYWLDHRTSPRLNASGDTAPWWPSIQAKYLATLAPDKRAG
jgi:hypothetical protein